MALTSRDVKACLFPRYRTRLDHQFGAEAAGYGRDLHRTDDHAVFGSPLGQTATGEREYTVCVDGLAPTARPLTALETAAAVANGSAILDRALQRHVDFPAVYRAYCRNPGAHGGAASPTFLSRRPTAPTRWPSG
jgi:hypothetical protein